MNVKQLYAIFSLLFCFCLFGENQKHDVYDEVTLYHPTSEFKKQAVLNDTSLFVKGEKNYQAFWAEAANHLHWFQKWNKVLDWHTPSAKWFLNGKLNACYNCLDRFVLNNQGNKIAFFWEGENGESKVYSYLELYKEVNRLANGLKSLGVKKGDKIVIYLPLIPENIASILACARIGAVHSVIFGGVGAGGVKDRILDAEAKVVITADGGFRRGKHLPFREIAIEAIKGTPSVEKVIVVKRNGKELTLNSSKEVWYHDLLKTQSNHCPPEEMDSEDLLFLLYTSGSTGKPKGIMHTTAGYMVGVNTSFKWVFDYKPNDIYWCTADTGWITGHSYVVYGPLSNGVTQVIYEGSFDYPDKDRIWQIAEKYGVTIFYTAPTAIRTFMKWGEEWISKHDLSSLRLLGSIGEPLNPDVWKWYRKNVGHDQCPIVDTWFQTETGAFVIAPLPGLTPLKPGSVTKALPGLKIDVLDEEGNSTKRGYLAIIHPFPSMLRGIYKNEERYKDTYWNKWNGKYYYTGDGAYKDKDGYIWVTGRLDDVLKVSGHRIGSAELESTLVDYPSVAEAAVVGIPDPLKGEKIVAFVILKENATMEENLETKLKEFVAGAVGSYAKPEQILFVSQLPKNRSGKIMRRLLRNLIEGKEIGDITTLESTQVIDELKHKCDLLFSQKKK